MGVHVLSDAQLLAFTALVLVAGYSIVIVSNVLAFRAGVAVGKRSADAAAKASGREPSRSSSSDAAI